MKPVKPVKLQGGSMGAGYGWASQIPRLRQMCPDELWACLSGDYFRLISTAIAGRRNDDILTFVGDGKLQLEQV
ncbi:hypothetical protein [Stenotrophomonas sp.]|uniref:hypothetical protein n=1 Tax=Stenotrophomonas sp. TaxID=69392 RepID=UPI0028A5BE31|nr:hypothetical protein [Stenotrophomonas sp.]